jgi:hypothetical protein
MSPLLGCLEIQIGYLDRMKNCLIYQPGGLGDIMFIQPIIDNYINQGYTVNYPILSEYFKMVNEYIVKDNLIWYDENNLTYLPLLEFYSKGIEYKDEENIYVPLEYSDWYIISNGPNIAKYFYTNTPLGDWRNHLNIKRNREREQKLIDKYNLHGDYIIINNEFTGLPYTRTINVESNLKIHHMNWRQDQDSGFHLFDWIGALENAKEIHSVGTSVCYIIDKYCTNNTIFIYERRLDGQPRNYHRDHYIVYRNPNWVYMN